MIVLVLSGESLPVISDVLRLDRYHLVDYRTAWTLASRFHMLLLTSTIAGEVGYSRLIAWLANTSPSRGLRTLTSNTRWNFAQSKINWDHRET